jgi:predicted glycoside hydrolase/deacetylase ChbG (UPF0249 family)
VAHERGIVTSASLMVRWPSSMEAADYARSHMQLSLGLHVDFGEWTYRNDTWVAVYQVIPTDDADAAARELALQLECFRHLVGTDPTHLDSHQHVHRTNPLRSVFVDCARQLGIPLRDADPGIRYDGSFYGQSGRGCPVPEAITVEALVRLIEDLPPGVTELGCHPGERDDTLDSMYSTERVAELKVLCDPRVRAAIRQCGVRLVNRTLE